MRVRVCVRVRGEAIPALSCRTRTRTRTLKSPPLPSPYVGSWALEVGRWILREPSHGAHGKDIVLKCVIEN